MHTDSVGTVELTVQNLCSRFENDYSYTLCQQNVYGSISALMPFLCSLVFSSAYKLQADDVVRLYVLCYAVVCIVANPCTLSAGVL